MISKATIEKIREATDLVDLIEEVTPLERRGKDYWGLCPFHSETTPSFSVSPQKGFFYCFGCHVGGNVFSFVMEWEKVDFPQAVAILGLRAGVPVEETGGFLELYRACADAASFYKVCLWDGVGEEVRTYLSNRGVDERVWEESLLGYAPQAARDGGSFLQSLNGSATEAFLRTGLVTKRKEGGGLKDFFSNRLVFPWRNLRGQVVGFGGRALNGSKPVYLNSPDGEIFKKRSLFYGLYEALPEIRARREAVVVEGYFDLLVLRSFGLKNVVATGGTSFTQEQADRLRTLVRRVTFFYDGDRAGEEATFRAGSLAQAMGLEVLVARPPEGKDPADLRKDYERFLLSARPFLDYGVRSGGTKVFVPSVLSAVAEVDDPVQRSILLRNLATKLDIDYRGLEKHLASLRSRRKTKEKSPPSVDRLKAVVLELFSVVVLHHEAVSGLVFDFVDEDLIRSSFPSLLDDFLLLKELPSLGLERFFGSVRDKDLLRHLVDLLSYPTEAPEREVDPLRWAADCVSALLRGLLRKAQEAQRDDLGAVQSLALQIRELTSERILALWNPNHGRKDNAEERLSGAAAARPVGRRCRFGGL